MIKTEDIGKTRVITISRPDKANALTEAMLCDLRDAVLGADGFHSLILTGDGHVFSAGADLKDAAQGLAVSPVWEELSSAIAAFPGLTIAALNGTAAGGSLGMVLACDLRVSVEAAKIFYPVMALGFLPQPSDPGRLVALVGSARAKMILMAGAKVQAAQAMEWGLIDAIVPRSDLVPHVMQLAVACNAADRAHVTGIKAMIVSSQGQSTT